MSYKKDRFGNLHLAFEFGGNYYTSSQIAKIIEWHLQEQADYSSLMYDGIIIKDTDMAKQTISSIVEIYNLWSGGCPDEDFPNDEIIKK